MNMVRHIVEPMVLLLAWQGPEHTSRRRWTVGRLDREMQGATEFVMFTYLSDTEEFECALREGFTGYPAFRTSNNIHDTGVMSAFMRRLPPRTRGDFAKYLLNYRIDPGSTISDFALLGYTEARLPSDGFSIVNPFYKIDGPCEFVTEAASFHRYLVDGIRAGDHVFLIPEPTNIHDDQAIQVVWKGQCVGYINRLQTEAFHRWLSSGKVQARVDRVNGTTERPRLYLFVEVSD
ncbi:HIRAN domain-containing protein [Azospirillum sp. TSO22-1]|uniref:HIRAN domain-containing protein n=1 Tax=Azospirillum sp. TSO22-1 TaxID=716789 RepID=UPI000D65192A|nr:HIRAN domain-containing protein [Azospirillum sp. TSO22-1]